MTIKEAMERFGIKETEADRIQKKGVMYLMQTTRERLKVWSMASSDRARLEKDIEAYKALLQIAK